MKSTHSNIYDPSAHVLYYKSYVFSMSVVFTLNDILCLCIFVFGGNKERKKGVLNVVDFAIFSLFEKNESYHSDVRGLLTTSPIWSGFGVFLGILIILFQIY